MILRIRMELLVLGEIGVIGEEVGERGGWRW